MKEYSVADMAVAQAVARLAEALANQGIRPTQILVDKLSAPMTVYTVTGAVIVKQDKTP